MSKSSVFVIMNITHKCNLSCGYCYYADEMNKKNGVMSIEVIENVFKSFKESSLDAIDFCFHGGEPLTVQPDFYEQVFELSDKFLSDKEVSYSIQTNGTIINEKVIELMKKYNIELGISLDGPEKVHNYFRKYKDGKGSFGEVIKNIDILKKNNVSFGILSVCNDKTLEFSKEYYPFFKSIAPIRSLDLIPPDCVESQTILSKGNLSKIFTDIFNQWFYDNSCTFDIRFLSETVKVLLGFQSELCTYQKNCIRSKSMVSIDINGDVSPCDNLTHIQLGNVKQNSADQFISKSLERKRYGMIEDKRINDCVFCEWFKQCNGGCTVNSKAGDNNYYCSDFKKIFSYVKNELIKNSILNFNGKFEGDVTNIPNPKLKKKIEDTLKMYEDCYLKL